jgi:hypothetical protein
MDLIYALPSNSFVNTVQHATIEEAVFSVDPTNAPIDWLNNDQIICIYCRFMSVPWLRVHNVNRDLYVQGELELGVQKITRGQPVKTSRVLWRFYLCVTFAMCDSVRLL